MKRKTLENDEIQLNIEATDWEDAIRKTAMPLVCKNKITPKYVDEVIRSAREEGPYFVIMKHVAMPHTKPEHGAVKNAVSLATLKEPVCFGHCNDPVKVVIFLSSVDGEEHLQNISRIAELLGKEEFMEILSNVDDKEMLCDFFNK